MTTAVSPEASGAPLDLAGASRLPLLQVLARLGSGDDGLPAEEADSRLRSFGPNALSIHYVTAFGVLYRQLRNPS